MKLNKRWIFFLIILIALVQGTYGVQVTASGGNAGNSGAIGLRMDVSKEASIDSKIAINGADIKPSARVIGPTSLFDETHGVTDRSTGKSASVHVKVVNAQEGLTYNSVVLPKEGVVGPQTWVSAEQWLTVPKADSIIAKATASSKASSKALSADAGIEEYKGSLAGGYVTLTGYYDKAYTSASKVYATQTATEGAANSIRIFGHSNDGKLPYSVDTKIDGISGANAAFKGLDSLSSAGKRHDGVSTQVSQSEHLLGKFTSTSKAGTNSKTRISDYGNEYDLNMKAREQSAQSSDASGTVGYYVDAKNPAANKIQGAVNAARNSDIINLAAGTYKENIQIDKSLTVKGSGAGSTIVDGDGSVFVVGPKAVGTIASMTIQGGTGTLIDHAYLAGGGILNYGTLTVKNVAITGNIAPEYQDPADDSQPARAGRGGGIANYGTLAVKDSTISRNAAEGIWSGYDGAEGGGIYNDATGTAMVEGSTISGNTATYNGGGIYNAGTLAVTSSTVKDNTATGVEDADSGGCGGGIYNVGTAKVTNSIISGNKANYEGAGGGGIYNWNTLTVDGSTITGNYAEALGGGIANGGKATIANSIVSWNKAANGGGISNSYLLTVKGSTISDNTANYVSFADGGGVGGGIANSEGGYISDHGDFVWAPATLTVTGSTITRNKAIGFGDYFVGKGGGIANWGTAKITRSTISENTAATEQESGPDTPGEGGGIYNGGTLLPQSFDQGQVHDNNPDQINPQT